MSKKDSKFTSDKEGRNAVPLAETAPTTGLGTANIAPGSSVPAPRFARFGEDGSGESKEQDLGVQRASVFERIGRFVSDVRAELRRVSWPTADQVKNTTIVTLIAVIFFAVYLYVVDQALVFLITQLEKLAGWLFGAT